jgi:hypothetical protein
MSTDEKIERMRPLIAGALDELEITAEAWAKQDGNREPIYNIAAVRAWLGYLYARDEINTQFANDIGKAVKDVQK